MIMHGEPDRRAVRIGPFDAMERVRRDVDMIPRREPDGFRLALEREDRGALKQKNPFGLSLVVPEAGRARMPVGHDALDAHRRRTQQLRELFLRALRREAGKQVPDVGHRSPSSPRVVTRAVSIGQAGNGSEFGGNPMESAALARAARVAAKPIPFDAARLDALLDDAGIDVVLATSKHNVQYLLGGYRFFFFDYMDAIGVSRYLPVVVYQKGRPDNSAYIGCHLESHEKQLGKFWPRVVETTSSNSISAIQRAVEHIRGLPGPIGKVGVEASFLPWDGAKVLQDGLDNRQIVDAYFPLERLGARKRQQSSCSCARPPNAL